jgi:hypothetical protein
MDSEDIIAEERGNGDIFVYIKGGILNLDVEDVQRRLEEEDITGNLTPVRRVLYGMKVVEHVTEGIALFVEVFPSAIYKEYLYVDIDDERRLYIEELDEGITMFMACTRIFEEIESFANLSRI